MVMLTVRFIALFCIVLMKSTSIISKVSCIFLLCIFAISNTPKNVFHSLIADHNDGCFDNHQLKGSQLTKQGTNCHFENLVVESPYVWSLQFFNNQHLPFYSKYECHLIEHFYSQDHLHLLQRGPPGNSLI